MRIPPALARALADRRLGYLALAAWAIAALLFAGARAPFDDEWFSISLASETDWPHFWASLSGDCHPPWVALLDRLLYSVFQHRIALVAARVAFIVPGIVLLAAVIRRRLSLPLSVVVLAAFHPIFFYYAGAARWYPVLFLAQALRAWGLWGASRGGKRGEAAFLAGALIGPLASYVDLAFLALDGLFALIVAHRRGIVVRAVALLALAALAHLVVLGCSPLGGREILGGWLWATAAFKPESLAGWALLGALGEAHLEPPLVALALLALPGLGLAVWRFVRGGESRLWRTWVLGVVFLWAACTVTQIWHPRYSLLVWLVLATLVLGLLRERGLPRVLGGLTVGYLGLGLALTLGGAHFIKGDLNRLGPDACEQLLEGGPVDLVIAPYARTAMMLERGCAHGTRVVSLPNVRHFPDEREQLDGLRNALGGARRVTLAVYPVADASLAITNARTWDLVASRCRQLDEATAAPKPHQWLRRRLRTKPIRHRLVISRWDCQSTN